LVHEIPGYRISKPIEIGIISRESDGSIKGYVAFHFLPAYLFNFEKNKIVADGKTEDEAGTNLGLALGKKLEDLKNRGYTELLSPAERLEKQYLETILEGKVF
jgi:hypothetical protein